MTQEHDKREDIRHKTADAITKIHELMEVRRRMPSSSKDPHDEGDIAGVARISVKRWHIMSPMRISTR